MWNKLYNAAVKVQNSRTISPFIDAGGVVAAILTKQGNIYVGVCIDTASTLGMCAERNAISTAIANGEKSKLLAVAIYSPNQTKCVPCGACRQWIYEFAQDAKIILEDTNKEIIIFDIQELLPEGFVL